MENESFQTAINFPANKMTSYLSFKTTEAEQQGNISLLAFMISACLKGDSTNNMECISKTKVYWA